MGRGGAAAFKTGGARGGREGKWSSIARRKQKGGRRRRGGDGRAATTKTTSQTGEGRGGRGGWGDVMKRIRYDGAMKRKPLPSSATHSETAGAHRGQPRPTRATGRGTLIWDGGFAKRASGLGR